MLIKNISSKPVHVDNTLLMPDAEIKFKDAVRNEIVDLFEKLKIIAISPDPKEEEAVVEEPKQAAEPEEKPKKGSKKKE